MAPLKGGAKPWCLKLRKDEQLLVVCFFAYLGAKSGRRGIKTLRGRENKDAEKNAFWWGSRFERAGA